MGAKKTGLTDTEYGKELYVAVAKLEEPKEARKCRKKLTVEFEVERETKISITDSNMQDIYTTLISANSGSITVRVVLANTYMGNGYYVIVESTDKELRKQIFVETNR